MSGPPTLVGRSLLKELDWSAEELLSVVGLGAELKAAKRAGPERQALKGKNFALVFEKASTRTRCSFEVAAYDQGAHMTTIAPTGSHLGREESLADTARFLGRLYDGIAYRGSGQERVEELARHAGVPVWNGLTDQWHPTQVLADLLTMQEIADRPLFELSLCFLGDTRFNMARSLAVGAALVGMDVRLCGPRALWPPEELVALANQRGAERGGVCQVTDDPAAALDGVDFVYTDVWLSMGEPPEAWRERAAQLGPYRVTAELLALTNNPGVRFLHCLPALHDRRTEVGEALYQATGLEGIEVTDDVFSSSASVVFDQAENRMHTIKALMVATAGG